MYDYSNEDIALSYAIAEAEEAEKQRKLWTLYNNGIPALPDHNWVIEDGKISEVPDYSNLTKEHYCFRLYKYDHWNKECWNEEEGFELWKESVLNPSLNGLFKLIYTWNVRELVPDKCKLFELITKDSYEKTGKGRKTIT